MKNSQSNFEKIKSEEPELEEQKPELEEQKPEISHKEQRIRDITFIYYSQSSIQKAIYEFSKNRECIPRYYEGFGKRPDNFQYPGDILEQVKRGATSFHCSEELWQDPLEISTDLSRQELDDLRIGWDLLLDIDSPYLEYSKIYTKLLVSTLKFHGVENFSIKFSGSKGFHLLIPWKAFPKQIYNQKTKNMFPEFPRIICEYLADVIKPKLADKIFENQTLKELAQRTGKKEQDLVIDECLSCHRPAVKKYQVTWICENCKNIGEVMKIENNKRIPLCPNESCRKPLIEKSRKEILFCEFCNLTSIKSPEMFAKSREKTELLIDADLILVAPRHLFRMPYSLHEKTALSSIVIDKDKILDFQITDAKPFKSGIKNFYLEPKPGEAKELLLQALDWNEQKQNQENIIQEKKQLTPKFPNQKKDYKDYKRIIIENPSEEIFPPQIKLILQGVKQDGRKRSLFILLSFLRYLGVPENEAEKRINKWNEKNYLPLKKGYIQSQLNWYYRNPPKLPPNFNNPIYKDLGIDKPDQLAMQLKNPVNYAIKKYFGMQR